MSGIIPFFEIVGVLDHVAFIENRNVVFIWSVEMCFIFVVQTNVIFMGPLYQALCDCIINRDIWLLLRDICISYRDICILNKDICILNKDISILNRGISFYA